MVVVAAPSFSSSFSSSSSSAAAASASSSPASASLPALTATPPQATASHERPSTLAASDPGPLPVEYLKLANGAVLSFSKQSVPDPPSISFAKDIPRLISMWDDGSPEWSPSEAVLRVHIRKVCRRSHVSQTPP
ncbi:hypothetical protein EDB85DRAFT_2009238 [Lactarius pseudohatsudake]|nr:hypothetical protein EDB85DRAFT_2009238 [Lactarius pseudohatsudake]